MIKKLVFLLIVIGLVLQFTTSAVFAAGNCPGPFHLETAEHHDHHHHRHVGTSTDKNGDEFICVKHLRSGEAIHVHIDNNLP